MNTGNKQKTKQLATTNKVPLSFVPSDDLHIKITSVN